MKILVSACLLGLRCRYDGQSKPNAAVLALGERHQLIPCCPEQLGGLPTPRSPSEWRGDRIVNREGRDVTEAYRRGGGEAVRLARTLGCELAILKERSPACGSREIYDGSFSGVLIPGQGSAAIALRAAGIPVIGESELDKLG
jgi:uncharacterized protein YbbK (DUF523 family)